MAKSYSPVKGSPGRVGIVYKSDRLIAKKEQRFTVHSSYTSVYNQVPCEYYGNTLILFKQTKTKWARSESARTTHDRATRSNFKASASPSLCSLRGAIERNIHTTCLYIQTPQAVTVKKIKQLQPTCEPLRRKSLLSVCFLCLHLSIIYSVVTWLERSEGHRTSADKPRDPSSKNGEPHSSRSTSLTQWQI